MTRETKIGLLVGLAFMIVIGILLQQQARNSTEPPPAQLPQVTDNVQRSVQTGTARGTVVGPVTPTATTPRDVMPTAQDLVRPAPPIRVVIGGPSHPIAPIAPITPRDSQPPVVIAQRDPAGDVTARTPDVTPTPTEIPASTDIQRVAANNGEQLVPIGPTATPDHTGSTVATAQSVNKKYVAQAGDTVSRMAGRFMPGGNTNANRAAVIKANIALQQNSDRVIVGQTYIIPLPDNPGMHAGAPATPALAPMPTPTVAAAAGSTPTAGTETTPASNGTEIWYVVKKGDSLGKIALEQCGDVHAKAAIIELNRDKINDEDTIYENMKLKLPAKPLATAQ